MASIDECKRNIVSYGDMKDKVKAIITYLNTYDEIDDKVLLKINQNYIINNDNAIISDRIKDLSTDVNKTSNYLKNTILPAIDAAIKSENNAIDAILAEQQRAQERRAQEQRERELAAARALQEEQARQNTVNVDTSNNTTTKPPRTNPDKKLFDQMTLK